MAGGIKWDEAKAEKMRQRLDKLAGGYSSAAFRAAGQVAQQVINDAINIVPTVPLRTGNLRSSGTFEVFSGGLTWRSVRLVVGFNTPYAAAVHQGGWKTGPLAGKKMTNWSESGSGPYFLSSKLQRFRVQYVRVWGDKVARLLGMKP